MGKYIASTARQQKEMLDAIGIKSLDELFRDLPQEIIAGPLNLPEDMSEIQLSEHAKEILSKNKVYKSIFRGAGAYDHYIPSVVRRQVAKEEFVTAYTPYQPEISQGILQAIFEYQTMICELTGMEASNASVYDGHSAAAEALAMTRGRKGKTVLISKTVDPRTIETVRTYCFGNGLELKIVAEKGGVTDLEDLRAKFESLPSGEVCGFYVAHPNFYGNFEEVEQMSEIAHSAGGKIVMGANPISLAYLKSPAEMGVDIATGEAQPLGLGLNFGGPYLGYMATNSANARLLPGRIVGETVDTNGKRAFVLTLQAREQHIRREKSSSNICSNQALCALQSSVYMATLGIAGLQDVFKSSFENAHYLQKQLENLGFKRVHDSEFFNEFLTTCPVDSEVLLDKLNENSILGGLPLDGGILWCATEKNTKSKIDELISIIEEVVK